VTLKSIDDQLDEPTETFDLNLSDATAGVGIAPRANATVSVADDDETALSGKTQTVADFEGDLHVLTAPNPDQSGLFTFAGSDAERPALTGDTTVRPGSAGAQSMKVVSSISSYGGFSNNLAAPADWSAYDGFAFWFKGTNTGKNLQFEIKDGGNDGEHCELWESHAVDDCTAWRLVRTPFSKFTKRTDYQPGGGPTDGKLDLTKMWGFAMNLGTGANAFLIDDVQVFQQVLTVEDFEGTRTLGKRGFSAFNGGGGPPALAIESQPRDDVTDNHALKVDYDVPSGGYGGFVQDLADPQDWSAFKGIRFWYYGRQRASGRPGACTSRSRTAAPGPARRSCGTPRSSMTRSAGTSSRSRSRSCSTAASTSRWAASTTS
jgi:beta-glucosidase